MQNPIDRRKKNRMKVTECFEWPTPSPQRTRKGSGESSLATNSTYNEAWIQRKLEMMMYSRTRIHSIARSVAPYRVSTWAGFWNDCLMEASAQNDRQWNQIEKQKGFSSVDETFALTITLKVHLAIIPLNWNSKTNTTWSGLRRECDSYPDERCNSTLHEKEMTSDGACSHSHLHLSILEISRRQTWVLGLYAWGYYLYYHNGGGVGSRFSITSVLAIKSSHSENKLSAGCIRLWPEFLLMRNRSCLILSWLCQKSIG